MLPEPYKGKCFYSVNRITEFFNLDARKVELVAVSQ